MISADLKRFFLVLHTLLSHYLQHPGQAVSMAVGLITGVALWSAVQLINDHARASYAEADQLLGAEALFWIRNPTGNGIRADDYIRLRRAGFNSVYPVIETVRRTRDGGLVSLIATDLLALPMNGSTSQTGFSNPFAGTDWLALIQPEYQAWYPASLARQLGVAAGERLQLADGTNLPPAVLQTQEQQGQRVFMDAGAALAILQTERFSYLGVSSLSADERRQLEALLSPDYRLVPNEQAIDLAQLTASLHTNLTAMGLLSFAVGLFIVFNAVRFSLLSRQATLATLREMGVSVLMLVTAVIAESFVWAVIGTAAGLVAGLWLSELLLPAVATSMQSLFSASLGPDIQLDSGQVMIAFGLTSLGVLLALAVPLWQRARESILKNRSPSDHWQRDQAGVRQLAILGLLLAVSGLLLYPLISTVVIGFVVLGCVLFAGALVLPVVLQSCMQWGANGLPDSRWRLRWAIADSLAQLPHLRIALMAMLLALTTNIGVVTLVGSFRTALSDWLEIRLSADLFVQSQSLDVTRLADANWLEASHERLGVALRYANRPAGVRGLEPGAPDVRQMTLPMAEPGAMDTWIRQVGSPPPILASEQVHYLADTPLGATIELPTPSGLRPFRVVGFFHDYGSSDLHFYLPRSELQRYWPGASSWGVALWVKGDGPGSLEQDLLDAGARPGEWIWQNDIKQVSFRIFDRTFAITAALNTLTLLVAAIALLAALLALHQQRLNEYGRWRAMGVSFPEWLKVVALPLIIMTLVTALLAMPLGLILSWLLIHELNVMAFGWTMPLRWTWIPVLELVLTTLGVVALALLFAILRVRRTLPTAVRQLAGDNA